MKVLGIETSCDETAVAIVSDDKKIHVNNVFSQIKEHMPYGGVVPEIAARAHIEKLDFLILDAMEKASVNEFSKLDAVAVTAGPGLIGGVIVGVMVAKAIASVAKIPIIAVNHLEGHALTARLTNDVEFPFLLLLMSGGHCQILVVSGVGKYTLLGYTIDDALGEAFDKIAKSMKLGYPGGPIVEKLAQTGDKNKYKFPRSMVDRPGCDFSFSGIKTAVKRQIDSLGDGVENEKNNICASFQECVADIIQNRLQNAINIAKQQHPNINTIVAAGGVAANQFLAGKINELSKEYNFNFVSPPLKLCTDNGAMIAWAGLERLKLGLKDNIDFCPKARWNLF